MPFRQQISNQPPTVDDLQKWEDEGCIVFAMLGPILARKRGKDGEADGEGKVVFVTYMRVPGAASKSRIVSPIGVQFGNRAQRRGPGK